MVTVVKRECACITLTIAALNDLNIQAGAMRCAYLNAPAGKLICTSCRAEFGSNNGKRAIIVCAPYSNMV
jgi:hypothetical protein